MLRSAHLRELGVSAIVDSFQISAPVVPTTGDYLFFTSQDGDRRRPARIAGTALAILGSNADARETFLANIEAIRRASFDMARRNPTLDVVILGSGNFKSGLRQRQRLRVTIEIAATDDQSHSLHADFTQS